MVWDTTSERSRLGPPGYSTLEFSGKRVRLGLANKVDKPLKSVNTDHD